MTAAAMLCSLPTACHAIRWCPSLTCAVRCSLPHERGCLSATTTSPSTCILPAAATTCWPSTAARLGLVIPSPHCSLRLRSGTARSVASSSLRGRCLSLPPSASKVRDGQQAGSAQRDSVQQSAVCLSISHHVCVSAVSLCCCCVRGSVVWCSGCRWAAVRSASPLPLVAEVPPVRRSGASLFSGGGPAALPGRAAGHAGHGGAEAVRPRRQWD